MIYKFLLLIVLLTGFLIGQSFYTVQKDPSVQDNRTIYDFTNGITWNSSRFQEKIITVNLTGTERNNARVQNIVNKFVDFTGYMTFEVMKWAVEQGYQHPDYDYGFLIKLLQFALVMMVLYYISPVLLIIGMLIVMLVKYIVNKTKKRRET